MQGLFFHLQNEMLIWYKLDSDDDININFKNPIKKVMKLWIAKKKLASLVYIEKKRQKTKDHMIKCDYKSHIRFSLSLFIIPPLILTYHLFNFQSTTLV